MYVESAGEEVEPIVGTIYLKLHIMFNFSDGFLKIVSFIMALVGKLCLLTKAASQTIKCVIGDKFSTGTRTTHTTFMKLTIKEGFLSMYGAV